MVMMAADAIARPGLQIIRKDTWLPDGLARKIRAFSPRSELGKIISLCLDRLPPELAVELLERVTSCVLLESRLRVLVTRLPDSPHRCTPLQIVGGRLLAIEDRGITSRKVVPTAGVVALCAAWGSAAFIAIYMGLGTGSGAEAIGDTALTEITNTHYTGSARPACTHAEATNTVPIVGTHTQATAGDTVAEHGVFTSATVGNPTLWDRSLTGNVVLAVGDGLTGTYTLTASAGG